MGTDEKKLYCPACGKLITYEDGMTFVFCRYCGKRNEINDISWDDKKPSLTGKTEGIDLDKIAGHTEKLVQQKFDHDRDIMEHHERLLEIGSHTITDSLSTGTIYQKQRLVHSVEAMHHKERMLKEKHEHAANPNQFAWKISLLVFLPMMIFLVGGTFFALENQRVESQRREAEKEREHQVYVQETERLNRLESDIQDLIREGRYDEARIQVEFLRYNYQETLESWGAKKDWEKRQRQLIKTIDKAQGIEPSPAPKIKDFGITPKWPHNSLSKRIPDPGAKTCDIDWEYETGFLVTVGPYSITQYHEYVDACFNLGFNRDYYRSDTVFWGKNEEGNRIHIKYQEDDKMWLRMDSD